MMMFWFKMKKNQTVRIHLHVNIDDVRKVFCMRISYDMRAVHGIFGLRMFGFDLVRLPRELLAVVIACRVSQTALDRIF
jgi:hypothetical protein